MHPLSPWPALVLFPSPHLKLKAFRFHCLGFPSPLLKVIYPNRVSYTPTLTCIRVCLHRKQKKEKKREKRRERSDLLDIDDFSVGVESESLLCHRGLHGIW